jgi:hemoglobin/transferrin/lactoferrin receptor protein
MKSRLLFFGIILMNLCLIQSAFAENVTSEDSQKTNYPHTEILTSDNSLAQSLIEITGVKLEKTKNGVEIILETVASDKLQTVVKEEGNSFIADIPNAKLSLTPSGQVRFEKPVDGIAEISVIPQGENSIRLIVVGENDKPKIEVFDDEKGLIVQVISPGYNAEVSQSEPNEEANNTGEDRKEETDIEITVTGTRTPRSVEESAGTITVIDSEDIDNKLIQNLDNLIRYEPGVSTSGDPRRYGFQDFNIRGIDGNRILLQVDGVRLPESFDFGSTQLGRNYIDTETLQRVEIIRGSASTLYGSDAIGGVVTFITKDPGDYLNESGDDAYLSNKFVYDSANRGIANTTTVAARVGDVEGLLTYTRRDGFEAQINSDLSPNPQTTDTNSWLTKLVLNLDDFNLLKFTGEFINRTTDTDVLTSRGINFGVRTDSVRATDETRRNRYNLSYEYNNPNSPLFFQVLRSQIYYQDSESTEESNELRRATAPIATGVVNRRRFRSSIYEQSTFGGEIQLESNFKTGDISHRLVYGSELSTSKVSRLRDGFQENIAAPGTIGLRTNRVGPDAFPVKDIADTDNSRFGIYLQNEITWGNLTLIPGIRYDYYNLTPNPDEIYRNSSRNFPTAKFSDSAISPKLGLVYNFTPEFTGFAQYSRGFRAPTAEDINPGFTNPGQYTVIPNPDLKAESSNNFELGLRGSFPFAKFSISGFYNTYNNFIDTFGRVIPTPGFIIGTFQTVNRGEVRIYGLEAKGELELGAGFSLLASTSYTVGDDLESNEPLASVDPFKLVAGLRYRAPENRWGTELISTYAASPKLPKTQELPNPFVPDSYFVLDLIGYYNFSQNLTFNVGIFNLLNEKYWRRGDVRGLSANNPNLDLFVQPGISLVTGLTVRF